MTASKPSKHPECQDCPLHEQCRSIWGRYWSKELKKPQAIRELVLMARTGTAGCLKDVPQPNPVMIGRMPSREHRFSLRDLK